MTGTLTDAETVTVNGLSAPIVNGEYSRQIDIAGGWNTVNVIATSATAKQAHKRVDVFLAGNAASFSYDDNGNMTGMTDATGTVTLGYDAADRLTGISYPDSRPATSYTYNGRNKKVSQTVGTEVTRYLWDGDQIVKELAQDGSTKAVLVHGLGLGADVGSLVKAERGEQSQFFHYDWRGSVTALTDPTEQIIQSYNYDAFGTITQSTGTAVNPYQFSGKQFDPNSGLSYFGRRYYASSFGRFITQDPKEYVDGLNTYAYVKNNPVNLIDPLGNCTDDGECKSLLEEISYTAGEIYELWSELDARDITDDYAHCYMSCRIAQDYGAKISKLLGVLKELGDELLSKCKKDYEGWSKSDLKDDYLGIDCAKGAEDDEDCAKCCAEKADKN